MTLPMNETQVRQLIANEITSQLTSLETRLNEANRKALNEALIAVPSVETMTTMIEAKLSATRQEFQSSIHSIDAHLRGAEGRLSESGRRMDSATDKFESLVKELRESITMIKSNVEVNTRDIVILGGDIGAILKQYHTDRHELNQTIERLDDLKADIHGDVTKPDMPSLFHNFTLINDNFKTLDARLKRYDNLMNVLNSVWASKLGKAVTTVMVGAFMTDVLYQVGQIIHAIGIGKLFS